MVLVSVATYNEISNLPQLVDEIFVHLPQSHLLVIDDNSPDGTGAWCDQRAASDARLRCIHRPGKLGLGTATIEGLRYAIDHGYEYVINMDADLSHSPRYLQDMLGRMNPTARERIDVVIGSRYVTGGGVTGWPRRRRWMSRLVNGYARLMLGLTTHDNSGSFRCYRTSALRRLDFTSLRSTGYSIFEELLYRLQVNGSRFDELPIVFVDRERGKSKINRQEAISALRILTGIGVQRLFHSDDPR